jgi:WD40 repeat protein
VPTVRDVVAIETLLCLVGDDTIAVVDTETWQPPLIAQVNGRLTSTSIARDSTWIAAVCRRTVHIVAPRTGATIRTLTFEHEVWDVVDIPGRHQALVQFGESARRHDTTSWTAVEDVELRYSADTPKWSPDGSLLAVVTEDQRLRILDDKDLTCLSELRLDSEIHGCAWLDGSRLVVVGGRGVLWLAFRPPGPRV